MSELVDVVVVGMGVGGEAVAGALAERGLRVAGADQKLVGGECPYWGCVPSKMAIRAANLLQEARRIPGLAGSSSVSPDWTPVADRIRDEATDDWDDRVAVERFEAKGGIFVRGHGRLAGPDRVEVDGTMFAAERAIVIATGTEPTIPPIPGLESVAYWTNREAMEAKELPGSLVVVGGGAIGLELAQAYARFGSHVTVVEALDRVLATEEPEVSELVAAVLVSEGLDVHTAVRVTRVEADGPGVAVVLGDENRLRADRLLVATGRRADLGSLGVEAVGIDAGQPYIEVDEHLRAADGVWAVGDVTGRGAFTHVAAYQAPIAVADILDEHRPGADYRAVPRVTFTDPEVGSVGLTEAAAREHGISVRTGVQAVPSSSRGWIHKTGNEGLIKLVEDADRGVLVGATSVGPHGGEVLGMLTLAVHAEVPTDTLGRMIYAYPTFHRGVLNALADLAKR